MSLSKRLVEHGFGVGVNNHLPEPGTMRSLFLDVIELIKTHNLVEASKIIREQYSTTTEEEAIVTILVIRMMLFEGLVITPPSQSDNVH